MNSISFACVALINCLTKEREYAKTRIVGLQKIRLACVGLLVM